MIRCKGSQSYISRGGKKMDNKDYGYEYFSLVQDILDNDEFQKLSDIVHHGSNRLDHCLRVSYWSYLVSKALHLDYEKVTRAALLHDFFFEVNEKAKQKDRISTLIKHPTYALENSLKYFELTEMEQDIISTHMFPINFRIPKFIESWLVDVIDDVVAIYEKSYIVRKQLSASMSFLFIVIINYLR